MKCKWFFTLINIISICLIAASVLVLLSVVLTPAGQVPRVMGYSVLRVLTDSMKPKIPQDAVLLVQQTDPAALAVGDVISYYSPDPALGGALNTHRIVGISEAGSTLQFTTKGDANLIEDQIPVNAENVVGKVVYVSARLGTVIRLISNPLVFGLAVLLPLVLMLIGNLVSAVKAAARLAREEEEAAARQALEELKAKQNAQEK